jgi:hypothetical protein
MTCCVVVIIIVAITISMEKKEFRACRFYIRYFLRFFFLFTFFNPLYSPTILFLLSLPFFLLLSKLLLRVNTSHTFSFC